MQTHSIAIIGATGLVGTTLLALLAERNFQFKHLHLVASHHSVGKKLFFKDQQYIVEDLEIFDFSKTNLAFFCVGNDLASHYIPKATSAGNVVIDKSYFYRNHKDVPLIVPEVNIHVINEFRKLNIIANPNCTAIPLAVGLKPIYDRVGIARMNISTYQSVSGTGKDAVTELTEQSKQFLSQQSIEPKVYSKQIAFNVLPHCDDFQENGYTREEMKIVWELHKIFADPSIAINPTAVRVPVFFGHAAAIHLETKDKMTAEQAIEILANSPGIKVISGQFPYPTPLHDAVGNDYVYIGRIREDISYEKGLNLWIVADNIRKGAALNALQIAEYLMKEQML